MIYIQGLTLDGKSPSFSIIFDHGDFEKLTGGSMTTSPDGLINIYFTPDALWVSEQLKKAAALGPVPSDVTEAILLLSQGRGRRDVPDNHAVRKNTTIFSHDPDDAA